jgi:co-chaperonin GroES (HSP10)
MSAALVPLNNRVEIRVFQPLMITENGLHVPEVAKIDNKGEVLAVSPDGDIKDFVKVGDIIFFRYNSVEEWVMDGVSRYFVAKINITAILPKETDVPVQ